MQYICSLSYGKDSIVIPEICKRHGLPLDRIVHIEIMATPEIHSDLPPMLEFKKKADAIIKERYGIEVDHIHAPKSYEELFYTQFQKGKRQGEIYGFPMVRGAWCNDRLKLKPMRQFEKDTNVTLYLGICADEPERLARLTGNKRSPAAEFGYTEADCRKMAEELDLLSPIYADAQRGGCWFCHNQGVDQLRKLRKNYPEYWQLLLKWDKDSKIVFKPNGHTVHDYDNRFQLEDDGLVDTTKRFKWAMLKETYVQTTLDSFVKKGNNNGNSLRNRPRNNGMR